MFIGYPPASAANATAQTHAGTLGKRQCRQIPICMKAWMRLASKASWTVSFAPQRQEYDGRDYDRILAHGPVRSGLFGGSRRRHRAVVRRRLSEPPGALADRFRRRRPGRYRGAHHEPVAVGPFRPAVRGGEPHRLRRQYRRRGSDQLRRRTAIRCCSSRPTTRSAPRSTRNCRTISSATPCRSRASCS